LAWPGSTTATVTAGQTATNNLQLTPSIGFGGSVTYLHWCTSSVCMQCVSQFGVAERNIINACCCDHHDDRANARISAALRKRPLKY